YVDLKCPGEPTLPRISRLVLLTHTVDISGRHGPLRCARSQRKPTAHRSSSAFSSSSRSRNWLPALAPGAGQTRGHGITGHRLHQRVAVTMTWWGWCPHEDRVRQAGRLPLAGEVAAARVPRRPGSRPTATAQDQGPPP